MLCDPARLLEMPAFCRYAGAASEPLAAVPCRETDKGGPFADIDRVAFHINLERRETHTVGVPCRIAMIAHTQYRPCYPFAPFARPLMRCRHVRAWTEADSAVRPRRG